MFYLLIELSLVALVVTFSVTNIILPSVRGTQPFPWFRRSKVDRALIQANESLQVAELERLAQSARARADEIRKQAQADTENAVNGNV